MSDLDKFNYEVEGQISITDYLKSKIISKEVMDLTSWINSKGKAQYNQIGEVVRNTYEKEKGSPDLVGRITNAVSIYVLEQSRGYMDYLRNQSRI